MALRLKDIWWRINTAIQRRASVVRATLAWFAWEGWQVMTDVRIGSYNVQNLFARPKAFDPTDWSAGEPAVEAQAKSTR
jgi:hypothetical protein